MKKLIIALVIFCVIKSLKPYNKNVLLALIHWILKIQNAWLIILHHRIIRWKFIIFVYNVSANTYSKQVIHFWSPKFKKKNVKEIDNRKKTLKTDALNAPRFVLVNSKNPYIKQRSCYSENSAVSVAFTRASSLKTLPFELLNCHSLSTLRFNS